jgi:hypothetical protein
VHGAWPWILMALLGAYHGLNPAMGWLFAVALGMQEGRREAVTRSLVPIAVGHELSIIVVAAVVLGLGVLADSSALHLGAGAALIGFGIFRFVKPHAHFRWTTMRVNRKELTWWSFLMSSAHGAGFMVAPVLLGAGVGDAAASDHALAMAQSGEMSVPMGGLAIMLHVAAMITVMGFVAVLVYEHVGVAVLRKAWVNLDWIWAGAFIVAGLLTLFT